MEGTMKTSDFVDSKDKVYNAMREILGCLLHIAKYPNSYSSDEISGYFRQVENVLERAQKLEEASHE